MGRRHMPAATTAAAAIVAALALALALPPRAVAEEMGECLPGGECNVGGGEEAGLIQLWQPVQQRPANFVGARAEAPRPALRSSECPYSSVTDACSLASDGIVAKDCILGGGGAAPAMNFNTLTVNQGVRLVIARDAGVDLTIAASTILVKGELWVGCEGGASDAFLGKLLVQLVGRFSPGASADDFERKGMVVEATGRLEVHGAPKSSWQYLAKTAAAGTMDLTLSSDVDWQPGDELVIGSTSPEPSDSEVVTVANVSGAAVKLTSALKFEHKGDFIGRGAKLNAPVGLRSRNVRFQGQMADGTDTKEAEAWHACHDMHEAWARQAEFHAPTAGVTADDIKEKCFGGHTVYFQHSVVRIEGAEFTNMGENMVMARYPVHWHLAGNASGQYIRRSSFHNNFQRCTTIHGTSDVVIAENVCHETFGHAFYLEDGIETGNTFERNLVVSSSQGAAVCSDFNGGEYVQDGPSGFWITNPDNSFVDNHVIGVGTGYWFTFPCSSNGVDGRSPQSLQCFLAPDPTDKNSCSNQKYGAGGVMGPSREYFDSPDSGFGPDSWWTNQEQARTPVRLFKGNVVSGSKQAFFSDDRVFSSEDAPLPGFTGGDIPCVGIGCPTCTTTNPFAEGSFRWAPMLFDKMLPISQRTYEPTFNLFEDVVAAHINSNGKDTGRGIWAAGGSILFKGAIFYNTENGAAGIYDNTGSCYKVTQDTPAGSVMVFQDSLFIAGPLSRELLTIYDGGIHVVDSRWLVPADANAEFYVVQPKLQFGGNGNPIILDRSGPLGAFSGDEANAYFSWAVSLGPDSSVKGGTIPKLVSYANINPWSAENYGMSYVYSSDGFGLAAKVPTLVAADEAGPSQDWGHQAVLKNGEGEVKAYVTATDKRHYPQFLCDGHSSKWCGDGKPFAKCPAYLSNVRDFYKHLAPWAATAGR